MVNLEYLAQASTGRFLMSNPECFNSLMWVSLVEYDKEFCYYLRVGGEELWGRGKNMIQIHCMKKFGKNKNILNLKRLI